MLLILSQTLWSVNAKIVQTESRISSLLECFAEVQPILCKDCANRMQSSVLELLRCSQSSAKIKIYVELNKIHGQFTTEKLNLLALASGKADYNIQYCQRQPFNIAPSA
jgi:hypothetical protein